MLYKLQQSVGNVVVSTETEVVTLNKNIDTFALNLLSQHYTKKTGGNVNSLEINQKYKTLNEYYGIFENEVTRWKNIMDSMTREDGLGMDGEMEYEMQGNIYDWQNNMSNLEKIRFLITIDWWGFY